MMRRLRVWLTRWLGGDVAQVELLCQWLERAADGRLRLEQERRAGPADAVDSKTMRLLVGVMLVLYSMGIVIAAAFLGPVPGAWLLSAAHGLVTTLILLGMAGSHLLDDNDIELLGWWPLSMRSVSLARLGLLLGPVLGAGLAISATTLLGLLFMGRPPVLAALLQLGGLLLQTLGLMALALLVTHSLRRRYGTRTAQRTFWLIFLPTALAPWAGLGWFMAQVPEGHLVSFLRHPPWQVLLLPSSWAPSWGLLLDSSTAWIGVLVGIMVTLLAGGAVIRWTLSDARGESLRPMAACPARFPEVRLVEWVLWPFVRGREGWFLRRLTAAHVRDDPFTLGGLAAGTLVALGYIGFFLIEPTILESLPSPSGRVPTRSAFTFFLGALMLPMITLPSLVYSSDARALWPLAAANLDPRKLVRAQRGIARATSLFPLIAALLLVHARAGSGVLVAIADAALIWLVWELVVGIVQLLYPVMPFSRPREARGEELLPFFLMIMPAFVLLAVWTAAVYDLVPFAVGKLVTLAVLGNGTRRLHRKIDEGIALRGLPVELAPRVK